VEIGTPKREIVRVAAEQKAELIVLGSHGRHGLQLLLGSTANGVLHQATCDVLAVRVENG
jgi:universal stress protein A